MEQSQPTPGSPLCGTYAVPRIEVKTEDAECPFPDATLCVGADEGSTPFRMDSGYVSTRDHLGANTALEDSVEYRLVATCSPMTQGQHVVVSAPGLGEDGTSKGTQEVRQFYYGGNREGSEVTATYNISTALDTSARDTRYWLSALHYHPSPRNGIHDHYNWYPDRNASLYNNKTEGFTSMWLWFIAGSGKRYFEPTSDPLFRTQTTSVQIDPEGGSDEKLSVYLPAEPVTVLGCKSREEICNPSAPTGRICTPYSTFIQNLLDNTTSDSLSPMQRGNAQRLSFILRGTSVRQISESLSEPLLVQAAGSFLSGSGGGGGRYQMLPIPADQWRREVRRWFEIGLITLQNEFLEYATGPLANPAAAALRMPTQEMQSGARALCETQIIRNVTGAVNFDFPALLAVVLVGIVIIIAGLNVGKVGRSGQLGSWEFDDMFQLQKTAYEASGLGGWGTMEDKHGRSTYMSLTGSDHGKI